jgi:L-threonylcarbamoyladenylate synthase
MRIPLIKASQLLLEGQVVAVPTETVYGLAASLMQSKAINQVFTLKGRPANNPLIIHVADFIQIISFIKPSIPNLESLATNFWPGPLTLVLPINPELIPSKARAGLPTAAFRVPSHALTRQLLTLTGPLVMPSANLSGSPSSTRAEHVEADFGQDFPVLDGGPCECGVESTILYFDDGKWKIIRQGALSAEDFSKVLDYTPRVEKLNPAKAPLCPGQLYRHYAPQAKLIPTRSFDPHMQGIIVGFTDRPYPQNCRLISLGSLDQPQQIAENLYAVLRQLDKENIQTAWLDMNFPEEGILATVAERLRKAASSEN